MRWKGITIIAAAALLVQGCLVLSLHPLYTDKDVVFRQELVGTWRESPEAKEYLIFEPADSNSYLLKWMKEGKLSSTFSAHLVQVGEYYFLDIYPEDMEEEMDEFFASHLIPAHTLWLAELAGDTLRTASLRFDWFDSTSQSGQLDLKHERLKDYVVLTGEARDMQKLLSMYVGEAFDDFDEAYRVK